MLLNLIGNSLKFTEWGSVTAHASACDSGLQFEVTDTGIGIPQEKQGQIFEAFSQVDGSITRRFGGTGLGLTICARLVERMGGSISVSSAVEHGSTFVFTIRAEQGEGIPSLDAHVDDAPHTTSAPLRILVAEDNKVNQTVVLRMLERAGHTVAIAVDGMQAVRMCSTGEFDLVLMDVHMPVRRFRSYRPYPGNGRRNSRDRSDGECHEGRSRTLSCGRHGRIHFQAGESRRSARYYRGVCG